MKKALLLQTQQMVNNNQYFKNNLFTCNSHFTSGQLKTIQQPDHRPPTARSATAEKRPRTAGGVRVVDGVTQEEFLM